MCFSYLRFKLENLRGSDYPGSYISNFWKESIYILIFISRTELERPLHAKSEPTDSWIEVTIVSLSPAYVRFQRSCLFRCCWKSTRYKAVVSQLIHFYWRLLLFYFWQESTSSENFSQEFNSAEMRHLEETLWNSNSEEQISLRRYMVAIQIVGCMYTSWEAKLT